jgi:hypothetical protein
VKDRRPHKSVYVLEGTEVDIDRYNVVCGADPMLTSQTEALWRAGATFYKY